MVEEYYLISQSCKCVRFSPLTFISAPQNIYTIEKQVAAFGLESFAKYPALVCYCEHVLACYCVHVVHRDMGGFVLI